MAINNKTISGFDSFTDWLVAHFNLITIGLGLFGNTICFIIFRFHPSFKRMASMVFLSFVAITDTTALFEWNLDHFTQLVYNVDLPGTSLPNCRVYIFAQYSSLQASALTLSVMCIDRYITIVAMPGSMLYKLPFRTIKTAFFWSLGILIFVICLNVQLLFTAGIFNWIFEFQLFYL